MFSRLKDELCSGTLLEVGEASADKLEWRRLQVRQIESKREFTLKPGFNGMPVGRHDINWIRAGQGRNMQVCKFSKGVLGSRLLHPAGGGNEHQHEQGRYGQGRRPSSHPAWTFGGSDTLCDFQAKLGPRRKSAPGSLSQSLHLKTAECVCGAGGTRTQVGLHSRQFVAGKLAIHVQVEFRNPVASHFAAPRNFSASSSRIDFLARDKRDITVPIGIPAISAISW